MEKLKEKVSIMEVKLEKHLNKCDNFEKDAKMLTKMLADESSVKTYGVTVWLPELMELGEERETIISESRAILLEAKENFFKENFNIDINSKDIDKERKEKLEKIFIRSEEMEIMWDMVDKTSEMTVFKIDCPEELEGFIQEIGRVRS